MDIVLEKLDPSYFNTLPIRWDEDPVQSLSTINFNFSALDTTLCNLEFSANNVWNPLFTDFSSNSGKWDSVFTTVQENSGCWQSTYATVRTLSGSWLNDISVIYPSVVFGLDRPTITSWLRTNFPVTVGNCVNYLNGQIMNVFILQYSIATQKRTVRCNSRGGVKVVPCGGGSSRTINCGCSCNKRVIRITDTYVGKVNGLKYIVDGFNWTYVEDLY